MRSILPKEFKGVIFITGYRGKGKSFLASHIDLPQNIAFFDFDEGKGEGIHNQLNFGFYKAVTENEPLKRADMFMSEVAQMEDRRFTTVIIDNILVLEKALQAMVYRDAKKFADIYGYTAADILKDSYGKARGIVNDLIGDAIAKPLHEKGIKVIVVCSHVKDRYNVPGKMIIEGRDRWQQLSILTLVLQDGDNFPIPSAIVLKEQLGGITVNELTDEQYEAIMRGEAPSHNLDRRLPARLPKCDWQSIRWYLNNPADLHNPADGEKLVKEESDPFDERLSKEQIAYQLAAIKKEEKDREELQAMELMIKSGQENAIKDYIKSELNGMPNPVKLKSIQAAVEAGEIEYTGEITMAKITEWSV